MTTSGGFPEDFEPDPMTEPQPRLLVRTQVVLSYVDEGEGQVWYETTSVDGGATPPTRIILPAWVPDSMGKPGQVTVTVEPGDRLADLEDEEEPVTGGGHHSRSAQTGQFVTDEYAQAHPDVTVTEED